MRGRGGWGQGRPPWWPDDEAWPPRDGPWRHRRGGFARRAGCLFVVVVLLLAGLGAAGAWAIGTAAGVVPGHPAARFLAVVGLIIAAGLIVAGFRAVRRFAAPVDDLIGAAGRIEAGDFAARVPERGSGDVRALARAFNAMSTRLEANEAQRRRFLADVAHELRTPLTVVQGQLEGILDGVYPADAEHLDPVLDEVRDLERLVEDLRTLSLAETGSLVLVREPVEPALLVHDAITSFASVARAAGVTLRADLPADVPAVDLDPGRIRQVLGNLVANAVRHTPAGGSVVVAATVAGGALELTVRDTGTGIAPDLLPRVFDRFVKGEESRGTGLGLAIARDLVVAHGGTITAESAPAGGTTIRIRLPISASGS